LFFDRIYRIDMIFFLAFLKKAKKHHPLSAECETASIAGFLASASLEP
jgi:hypothetical protein